uniref:Uncharacterized protein n=1 Tax=Steinernema glaseri TaxID=37863 RepID=A0A1I7YUH0_9BILA
MCDLDRLLSSDRSSASGQSRRSPGGDLRAALVDVGAAALLNGDRLGKLLRPGSERLKWHFQEKKQPNKVLFLSSVHCPNCGPSCRDSIDMYWAPNSEQLKRTSQNLEA